MLRVRTVKDAADFVGAPRDPHDYTDQIDRLFAEGVSRPEWCFVIEDDKDRVGRIGLGATHDVESHLARHAPRERAFGVRARPSVE